MCRKTLFHLFIIVLFLFSSTIVNAEAYSLSDSHKTKKTYEVKQGDTLWGIAQRFYGDGSKWGELIIQKENGRLYTISGGKSGINPNKLYVGTKIKLESHLMEPYKGYPFVSTHTLDSNNNIYALSRGYDGPGVVTKNGNLYGGPFDFINHLQVIEDNIVYLAEIKKEEGKKKCEPYPDWWGYHVIFNKKINPHSSCGFDYKLFTLSPDKKHYALRSDYQDGLRKGYKDLAKNKFLLLSDLGDGPYYDYLDSIYWLDDQTIVYRAQNNDEWRIVVNNEDLETYDYIEDLSVDGNVIKFKSRENGIMVDRQINY